jgi:beta-lactamase class D
MKVFLVTVALGLAAVSAARADVLCTLVVDDRDGTTIIEEGTGCAERMSPASTFKLPLAVMGFDAGVLTGADTPAWPYDATYEASRPEWRLTTTPTTWLRDSVVWYSRVVVKELGAERFGAYVKGLDYGNADISGDAGKNNGLTNSWIGSSLTISPAEQVRFLRRLLAGELPVTAEAQAMSVSIATPHKAGAWAAHGKTGSYYRRNSKGRIDWSRQIGWYVGWAERDGRRIVFAHLIGDTRQIEAPAGPRARKAMLERLEALP